MTCAVCGSGELAPHLTVAKAEGESLHPTTDKYGVAPADIVRCGVCGHRQVAEFPTEAELGEAYGEAEDISYAEEEAGQRATANALLERIERHSGRGAICDLGCWLGFFLSEAERRGWEEAWGVEPSRFASEYARNELGLERVQTASIEDAELPQHHFDAVFMGDVIEHLPQPGEALDRIRGLLKPGGVLCLALPDAGSRLAGVLGARWWSVLPTHVQYFTRSSLARLLAGHGFTPEWFGTSPKTFTARYYVERLAGYSPPVAEAAVKAATAVGLADRLVTPDFRDRMAVVARVRD